MKRTLLPMFLLCGLSAWAQQDTALPPPTDIQKLSSNDGSLTRVENRPHFPGGEQALVEYMKTNLRYPGEMQKAQVVGTVQVVFTIADDGVVQNVRLQRGIPNGESLDAEALRVVNAMPRWEPARVNGVTVPMDYALPVTFVLQEQH